MSSRGRSRAASRGLNTGSFGLIAVVAVAAACAAALLVRRMLPHFPAGVVRAGSARTGTVLLAAAFLNVPLLTWIAEDNHWRGRRLASRPWPRPTAFAPRLGRPSCWPGPTGGGWAAVPRC